MPRLESPHDLRVFARRRRARSVPSLASFSLALSVLALIVLAHACQSSDVPSAPPPPIDPQCVQDQDTMTWADDHPIPGIDWADPTLVPERPFRMALVAVDFPDQPFVITQPEGSDPFGNPRLPPIAREDVARFYADFFFTPSERNHGHTIRGYWMEQSRGRFGVTELVPFGPYRLPDPSWRYGLAEWGQNEATPDGVPVGGRMPLEQDTDALWAADTGHTPRDFDAVLRIYAGYDETGVWQEFGEMKFDSKEDVPPEWGNPDPTKPAWVTTRYVDWTSWRAGAQLWGLSSIRQGENSGTITHELGHYAFGIPDLNNNPYVRPYRRVAAGPWDMMDRGSFNGPGGPHRRFVVPPTEGAAMPAGLVLRNRLVNEFVDESQVLRLSREGLAKSGVVFARITARAVEPRPGEFAGVIVRLDGEAPRDRTPPDDPAANPLSSGIPNYDSYSLEVVQRIGTDSFLPDQGVLLAKNKDDARGRNGGPNEFQSFVWVIDANPADRGLVDYVKPNGEAVRRTIADYRQLNDALFHAGTRSGSAFEWEDPHNRLHFAIVDRHEDERGILSYTVAVRALDGTGPATHGVELGASAQEPGGTLRFAVRNTGTAAAIDPAWHPDAPGLALDADLFRLSVRVDGEGWSAVLDSELVMVPYQGEVSVPVHLVRAEEAGRSAVVTLQASSENDPSTRAQAAAQVGSRSRIRRSGAESP